VSVTDQIQRRHSRDPLLANAPVQRLAAQWAVRWQPVVSRPVGSPMPCKRIIVTVDLEAGAIIVFRRDRIRVRRLAQSS
jgi:hypothetical protein